MWIEDMDGDLVDLSTGNIIHQQDNGVVLLINRQNVLQKSQHLYLTKKKEEARAYMLSIKQLMGNKLIQPQTQRRGFLA